MAGDYNYRSGRQRVGCGHFNHHISPTCFTASFFPSLVGCCPVLGCDLAVEGYYSHPLRPQWAYRFDDFPLATCCCAVSGREFGMFEESPYLNAMFDHNSSVCKVFKQYILLLFFG